MEEILIKGSIYLEYYSGLEKESVVVRYRNLKCTRAIVWDISPIDEFSEATVCICHFCGQVNSNTDVNCFACFTPLKKELKKEVFFKDIYYGYKCDKTPDSYSEYEEISLSEVRVVISEENLIHEGLYGQGIIEGTFEGIQKVRKSPEEIKLEMSKDLSSSSKDGLKHKVKSCQDSIFIPILLCVIPFIIGGLPWWGSYCFFILALFLLWRLRSRYFPYGPSLLSHLVAFFTITPVLILLIFMILTPCSYISYSLFTILGCAALSIFSYRAWPIILFSIAGGGILFISHNQNCESELEEIVDIVPEDESKDTDNDTIPDHLDQCPEEAEDFDGVDDSDGCPDLDNDQDGVPDIIDDCPNLPGSGLDGCPNDFDLKNQDSDEDGVSDFLDKCPDEKETINHFNDSDGCPDELPEDLQSIAGELYIQFDLNSNHIKDEITYNVELLSKLNSALQKYDGLRIRIDGHTDDRGDDLFNEKLSESRAESTKEAICQLGLIECSRIQTQGYGSRQPIVPNDSEENQARNRRVDISWFGEIDHSNVESQSEESTEENMNNTIEDPLNVEEQSEEVLNE